MGLEDGENPFKLPPDEQIFLIRERERRRRTEERDLAKSQRVWEKTTSASRLMHKLSQRSLRATGAVSPEDLDEAKQKTMLRKSASESGLAFRNPRKDKENVADFVAKKREMFLVQMSLDVKRAEIQRLDDVTKRKDEALKKSQQLLDEDFTRFDSFLRQNDKKAHKAMKMAEDSTRTKQERIQQIKTIRTQLAALQSEIARYREQKDECLKYKSFLVKLTPPEWKEARAHDKAERKRLRKEAWLDERFQESQAVMDEEIAAAERESEEKASELAARSRRRPRRELEEAERERERELEARKRRIRKKFPPRESFDEDYEEVSSGEEMPLYFQEPVQLLDIFTSLEGSNLFLIQNSQDKEQALEDLQRRFEETRRTSEKKTEHMLQGLHALERHIDEEKQQIADLREKLNPADSASSEQDQYVKELKEKIIEVDEACCNDTDHDQDAIQLLTVIEARLEEHLSEFLDAERSGLGPLVERLERDADVRRREKLKRERKEAQEKKTEERLKASLLRSQAPIHKKTGKQIMFRSAPLLRMHRVVVEDDGYEQAMREQRVFGMHMTKDGVAEIDEPVKATG